jgi:hypothetical protein
LQETASTQTDSESRNPAEPEICPNRLRHLRYQMLARLWWLVTPVAIFLWLREPAWWRAKFPGESFRAVRLEQWIALVQLALHGWFLWRVFRFRREAALAGPETPASPASTVDTTHSGRTLPPT